MKKNNITIQNIKDSVDQIFECQQNNSKIKSDLSSQQAEKLLLDHLMKAFHLIDIGSDV